MGFLRFVVRFIFWLLALIGIAIVAMVVVGFFFFEELAKPRIQVPDQAVLTIDLSEGLAKEHITLPFAPIGKPTIEDIVLGLEAAATDSRVKGVMLKVGRGPLNIAEAQEIRDALTGFHASSKPIHAFAESFGEAGDGTLHYYAAASADRIFLQPSGEVGLMGFILEQPFMRAALNWLGIQPRVSKRKEYKGAPDLFTETAMPVPLRENLQQLTDSWLTQVVDGIAGDRKKDVSIVRRWIDNSPWNADEAKNEGMVDELSYWDQAAAVTYGVLGEDASVDIAEYAAQIPESSASAPRFAIIRGNGPVILGDSETDPFGDAGALGSDTIVQAFTDAINDRVRAIIFRIDSPGGSYVGADAIWREVARARELGIPVIASFGWQAASGGYFIAAPATKIVSQPGTITGSIGVFAGKPVLTELWSNLNINFEGVQSGAAAGTNSVNRDYSPEAWAKLQSRLDEIYADFIGKVASGRKLSPEEVEEAAKGQVWTGADAQARGLVDELGGLSTAIRLAKQETKIAQETGVALVSYPSEEQRWESLVSEFMRGGAAAPALRENAALVPGASELARALRPLIEQPDAVLLWSPPLVVNGGVE
ncbi:S49 family peptidase [Dongia deserti]|uniref:S49 family peptidase n=1 Tax=Dongia deserti TaxID=2268030 RepID=UPI000E655052|nr:S49 family peptidase [Dongia deserti]